MSMVETRYYNVIWYVLENESEEDVSRETRIHLPDTIERIYSDILVPPICRNKFIITGIEQESPTTVTVRGVTSLTTGCENVVIRFYFMKKSRVGSCVVCEYKIRNGNIYDLAAMLACVTYREPDDKVNKIRQPAEEQKAHYKIKGDCKVKKKWKVICYTSKTTYDGQNINELRYEQYKKLKEEFEYRVRFSYNTLEVTSFRDHTMVSMMCRECAYDGPVTVEFNVTDLPILPIDLEGGTADKVYRLDQVNYNDVLSEISKEMMEMYGVKVPNACSSLSSVGFMYSDGSKLATYMNGESISTVNPPLPPVNEFNDYDALRDMIKSVTVNEKKRATTVVFKDGDVQIARCSKNDEYDKTVGIAICIAAHLAGSKEKLKKFVKEITE